MGISVFLFMCETLNRGFSIVAVQVCPVAQFGLSHTKGPYYGCTVHLVPFTTFYYLDQVDHEAPKTQNAPSYPTAYA